LLRIRVWKPLQYHGINHAEDSRVGLDAESERKWGDGGDAGFLRNMRKA
jgi:hypothetical protein